MAEMTAAEAVNVLNNKSCRIVFKAKNGVSYELREGLSEDIAALIERQAAEIGRLKLLCEKKTIENCKVIKQSFRDGVGRPEMIDGKCEGYAISDWDDEPHDSCKECIAGMESEEAWLQEMEGRR